MLNAWTNIPKFVTRLVVRPVRIGVPEVADNLLVVGQALDRDGGMSDVELEECRAALKASRSALVNLLEFPGRNPEDRAAVQSRAVELTPGQKLNLGGADVENTLVLR